MRTAEEILDKGIPLTDCTEEEINALVEYKAAILSRDTAYIETVAERLALMQAAAARFGSVAAKCDAAMAQCVADANARLDAACALSREVRADVQP